jgi:ribonucleoside-diphosphate reductase alpha chain
MTYRRSQMTSAELRGLARPATGRDRSPKGDNMTETTASGAAQGGQGAGRGLTIGRINTREGVHPYDEVTWERRDVVMTNWRDGSVNFEQKGVEFPDFWSVNATNIVTTKYFRGAAGSPEREWSLKQLVDRVVGTYTAAGTEHGYFATDADAEIFSHELTHALIHQIFSFNSPVWFNVGTSSPQQVSACQPYDALVSTSAGPVPIGKLVEDNAVGTKVHDAHGTTRIVAVKANGVKEVLRLHTAGGDTLDVTADHLVWRATDLGEGEFTVAGFLRIGDQLLHVTPDVGGTDRHLTQVSKIERLGSMEVYDIQTESGEYLSGTSANLRVHNCFILAVDDTMDSILEWYREEGLIFKGGSGSGVNLSRIRSSKELLSSGGTASGPVSFMRGADASAGTIKSGGATRRAAKMVVLDVDHPDVEEFIETKAREEEKVRVLRDAGFDMDLGGKDIVSVQYQNANNSVRVSDEFMNAVETGGSFGLAARRSGEVVQTVDAKTLFRKMAKAAWECADPGIQYDSTINDWHTCPESGRITASNPCSEYVHLDNSSCNLASINLLKFLRDDDTFDVERFEKITELIITAMDISICFADFPTEKITAITRAYRQLGIGYANLGALLMATGHAYDSEGGRAIAAAITSLMTGTAYRRSAELAGVVGPYDGYARNASAHKRVMSKHAAASAEIQALGGIDEAVLTAANRAWQECLEIGDAAGYRNAQASLLAPTGCLTGDTLITTDRGLARLSELANVYGERWQDLALTVSTDDGPRQATKFFVNGEEPTRRIRTEEGYQIQGTLTHRVKVVDPDSGAWEWKRLADIAAGDIVPMQLGTLVGEARRVPLPVLDQAYYTDDRDVRVPDAVTPELAELVGYFMGDGSLHSKGIRLCVADSDLDVIGRFEVLAKELFGLEPVVSQQAGYREVTLQSVRLARWWQAAGFAKDLPEAGHTGKGWVPRIPSAILETNAGTVYAAFLRGLFEADGTVVDGVPSLSTASESFAAEVRTALMTLGLATTTRQTSSGWGGPIFQVRLRNVDHALNYAELVGFIGERKAQLLVFLEPDSSAKKDYVCLPRQDWNELAPVGHPLHGAITQSVYKYRGVPRMLARRLFQRTRDQRLEHALSYLFERVASNEDGGVQPTYDLSVPDNVTYVANGMVSHNTIGLMMDCDTTGVEPDLALVKFKKLVGGGSMQIVNQTVPRALKNLGYQPEQAEAIIEYIAEHGHVIDAPGLRPEHYDVFDCAMGERAIRPMGHVRMMAAVQPALSGAISKTVNLPESASVEDIEKIYFEGWKLGLKALAIYRDNCKVGQPLSVSKRQPAEADTPAASVASVQAAAPHEVRPVRRRLPKQRSAMVTRFSVAGAEGYMTASSYPGDGIGEVFLKLGKQGSTLAGVMDAFSIAISVGLQYGIPLESYVAKFTNMRFDPAGITDDPDIRIASSVMDYIFRRLALDHLSYDQRSELGILSVSERSAALAGEDPATPDEVDPDELAQSVPVEKAQAQPETQQPTPSAGGGPPSAPHSSVELIEAQQGRSADAPLCLNCGTKMRPAGSCYVCEGCGSTSGCS